MMILNGKKLESFIVEGTTIKTFKLEGFKNEYLYANGDYGLVYKSGSYATEDYEYETTEELLNLIMTMYNIHKEYLTIEYMPVDYIKELSNSKDALEEPYTIISYIDGNPVSIQVGGTVSIAHKDFPEL